MNGRLGLAHFLWNYKEFVLFPHPSYYIYFYSLGFPPSITLYTQYIYLRNLVYTESSLMMMMHTIY